MLLPARKLGRCVISFRYTLLIYLFLKFLFVITNTIYYTHFCLFVNKLLLKLLCFLFLSRSCTYHTARQKSRQAEIYCSVVFFAGRKIASIKPTARRKNRIDMPVTNGLFVRAGGAACATELEVRGRAIVERF